MTSSSAAATPAGARVSRWRPWRRALSLAANLYARTVTGLRIGDLTSGFKCWRRAALASTASPRPDPAAPFQIEATFAVWESGRSIVESPIAFRGRASGVSKISARIVLEAAAMAWLSRFRKSRGRRRSARVDALASRLAVEESIHSTLPHLVYSGLSILRNI